jgi:predicted SAM-dependent methyltransferase
MGPCRSCFKARKVSRSALERTISREDSEGRRERHLGLKRSLKRQVAAMARARGYEISRISTSPGSDSTSDTAVLEDTMVLPVPEGISGVHYGCGGILVPKWLNVDVAAPPADVDRRGRFFRAVDLTQRHPFADASFDLGYAEDFLEHLSQAQSLIFLSEAYRTLRSGGVLRLSFPGLEGVLQKHYLGGSAAALAQAHRDAYESWGHVHFYSREELRLVASQIGFQEVDFLSFQESRRPELVPMDTRSEQADLNTYAELTK